MSDRAVEGGVLRRHEPGWCGGGECVSAVDFNFAGRRRRRHRVSGRTRSRSGSPRWQLAAGEYTFTTTSDDGVRVKVDGDFVIDDWTSHPATTFSGGATLTAGEHTIVVEYYQGGGSVKINATYTASP